MDRTKNSAWKEDVITAASHDVKLRSRSSWRKYPGGIGGVSISQLYLSSNEVRKKLGYYRGVCGNCGMTTTIEAASLPAAIPVVEDKVLITVCLVPVDNMAQNFVRYDTIRYEMLF